MTIFVGELRFESEAHLVGMPPAYFANEAHFVGMAHLASMEHLMGMGHLASELYGREKAHGLVSAKKVEFRVGPLASRGLAALVMPQIER